MFIDIEHTKCLTFLLECDKDRIKTIMDFMDEKNFIIREIKPIAKMDDRNRFLIKGVIRMALEVGDTGLVSTAILVTTSSKLDTFNYISYIE